ncbi:TPA: LysR family transcriptional regulator [Vibrio vulnificus]|uniref:LysR family transcriptional regulator n=1 Tax=Vibrio vulnificus TaxID=672 RepID=UPI0005023963|nr:LysR family transcriptional regulator [Vibrio vulnificus]EHY9867441.1 LysR family transcriptional regulator [Vibrio vulnificus]EIC2758955.1 LysR family transcriptional regulator [Vibrio vulnificus]EJA3102178.1 LysR family transcriptional regulator [Vibrio vulnificus]KFK55737.1 transcriptional regulator [Vibrio vulnificus]MCG9652182.1 LysR family transcriptional regulator [Vibrio vulnificus]
MKDIDWHKIDLNLLKILRVLAEEQNTRLAAERLFVGQSAVSKSLSKLRELFYDELFTRERHGLTPTPYCLSIMPKVNQLLESFELLLNKQEQFDPASIHRELCIAINPLLYRVVIPRLYPILRKEAPNAVFRFINWSWDAEAKLLNGQIDMGIHFSPLDTSSHIQAINLCPVEFQLCSRHDDPFAQRGYTIKQLASTPLTVLVMPSYANKLSIAEKMMVSAGLEGKVIARCDQLDMCLSIVISGDAVMPVCSLVQHILPEELILSPIPNEITLPDYHIALHATHHSQSSDVGQWLQQRIRQVILSLHAPEADK